MSLCPDGGLGINQQKDRRLTPAFLTNAILYLGTTNLNYWQLVGNYLAMDSVLVERLEHVQLTEPPLLSIPSSLIVWPARYECASVA